MEAIPRLERRMFTMAVKDLMAAQEQMLLLGRKTAREKVATFLVKLAQRAAKIGHPPSEVALPMSRADIADYLGLTIETVSRTLTKLKSEKLIDVPNATEIIIPNLHALEMVASGGN